MTYLDRCKLKNQINKAIYAIEVSQSPFSINRSIYAHQAVNILTAIRQGV